MSYASSDTLNIIQASPTLGVKEIQVQSDKEEAAASQGKERGRV